MPSYTPLPPLSLYIHFPWCIKKCPYCDFNSHQKKEHFPETAYIDTLLRDLENDRALVGDRIVNTIFLGGGTPSLFSATSLKTLLNEIANRLTLAPHCEITLEANPGTTEHDSFHALRDAGINRLSLGVQSFNDAQLKKLGRIHDSACALSAINAAKAAGFERINLDLMYALPDQTAEEAAADLAIAIEQNTTHLSWYQLTLEPNTLFHHRPPTLPTETVIEQMEQTAQQYFAHAGFERYEISAYCRNQHYCEHNLNYWQFGDYLGIGAGAHSKISFADKAPIRLLKHKHPNHYLEANTSFIAEQRIVTDNHLCFEFMLNALRLYRAVNFEQFETYTGLKRQLLLPTLTAAAQQGLLNMTEIDFTLTDLGYRFADDIIASFLPSPDAPAQ